MKKSIRKHEELKERVEDNLVLNRLRVDFLGASPTEHENHLEMLAPKHQRSFERKIKRWCQEEKLKEELKQVGANTLDLKKKLQSKS